MNASGFELVSYIESDDGDIEFSNYISSNSKKEISEGEIHYRIPSFSYSDITYHWARQIPLHWR